MSSECALKSHRFAIWCYFFYCWNYFNVLQVQERWTMKSHANSYHMFYTFYCDSTVKYLHLKMIIPLRRAQETDVSRTQTLYICSVIRNKRTRPRRKNDAWYCTQFQYYTKKNKNVVFSRFLLVNTSVIIPIDREQPHNKYVFFFFDLSRV